MTREAQYKELVRARKEYDPRRWKLENPAQIEGGTLDSDHVGPWTIWAHDLQADLMVVGQDWGDVRYFRVNRGVDKPGNPTNDALRELLTSVGRPIPPPPTTAKANEPERAECGVWLTNALLWLKDGGLSAPVEDAWFGEPAIPFLRAQVEIVQPRVVVALGQKAYACLSAMYGIPTSTGPYRDIVENRDGAQIEANGHSCTLLGVYHCGARIRNTTRSMEQQRNDWRRVEDALARTRKPVV